LGIIFAANSGILEDSGKNLESNQYPNLIKKAGFKIVLLFSHFWFLLIDKRN